MKRPSSLRMRVTLAVLLGLAALSALELLSLQQSLRASVNEAYDRLLAAATYSVADSLHLEGGTIRAAFPLALQEAFESAGGGRVFYRVTDVPGNLIAGDTATTVWPAVPPIEGAGIRFFDAEVGGIQVRAAVLRHPMEMSEGRGIAVIQVAHANDQRALAVRNVLVTTAQRQLLFAVLMGLGVVGLIHIVLRPVEALRARLDQRDASDVLPLPPIELKELNPVVAALNGLLARLSAMRVEQERFVANASHQLRTPLTVLKVQLQSALRDPQDGQVRLGEMLSAVNRASRLIDQLLALARVHQSRAGASTERAQVRQVVEEAVVELSPLIAERQLEFAFECNSEASVCASSWMLGEVVRNLLLNAIQHTPPGGELRVEITSETGNLVCRIADSGPGLTPAQMRTVFEPFATVAGRKGGSGLGLAICKEIAEMTGAKLNLANRSDGPGLIATLRWLPASPAPRATVGVPPSSASK